MAKFTEITVYTTHVGSELVSDVLWSYSNDGVSVSDVQDVIDLSKTGKTWDYMDDEVLNRDKAVLVKGYVSYKNSKGIIKEIEKELLTLKENCPFDLGTLETTKRVVDGEEWKEIWKDHFKPIYINNIVVVPEWIQFTPKDGVKTVYIGSNMAFGTGEHETTSMCVEYLQKYVNEKDVVLDVGCGSGILGITASKLGAKEVIMTDIDECAVKATTDNMKLNKVENAKVYYKNLLDDNTVKGDVIVANIMAEVLIAFAPYISKNLNENGKIILSGILSDRLEKVKKAYEENGFKYLESKIKGEWSCLIMQVTK